MPQRPKSRFGLSKIRIGLLCPAAAHCKTEAALQWPLRPIIKPKRPGKRLMLLYYNIHFYYNNQHAGNNSRESGFLIGFVYGEPRARGVVISPSE